MKFAALAIIATLLVLLTLLWRRWRRSVRADYIRTYTFPPALYEKLRKRRPELALKDCQLVGRALRQFFWPTCKAVAVTCPCPLKSPTTCGMS